jgi:hypothetical protein
MDVFDFELVGITPLLMHNDNLVGAALLEAWRKDPKNKNLSVPGDDRSPAWTWQTYLYTDGENVVIPSQNIMGALRHAGASFKIGMKSLRAATQSGLVITQEYCALSVGGQSIAMADVLSLKGLDFEGQLAGVKSLGFDLEIKRLKMPGRAAKNVRVRPKFVDWVVSGVITVRDPVFTEAKLQELFSFAGRYSGLLDWRPSAGSPGPCGVFEARIGVPGRVRKKSA